MEFSTVVVSFVYIVHGKNLITNTTGLVYGSAPVFPLIGEGCS